MERRIWAALSGAMLCVASGCPTQDTTPESSSSSGGSGTPCAMDDDCPGTLCVEGYCSAGTSSSGVQPGSSSTGEGSSSTEAPDAGGGDAHVAAGHIVLDPDPAGGPVEFGAARVGSPVSKTVLLSNTGDATATVVTLGFRNNATHEFTLEVVSGQATSIPAGGQITVKITHTPADATADHAFLTVATNADNPVVELELVAEFKGQPALRVTATPVATEEVTTLQVPPTPVGTPITAHLYVKNTGQADSALAVSSVSLNPAVSALFALDVGPLPRSLSTWNGACADLGGCSAAAAACTDGLCLSAGTPVYPLDLVDVALTFNAGQAGESATEIVIVVDIGGTPTTRRIPVAALAQDSRLEVTPAPIAFGDVFLGRSKTQQVTLRNPDDAAAVLELTDLGIRYEPSPYSVQLGGVSFPYPLTPGSSVVVSVVFAPTNAGSTNNSLLVSRSNGQPISVPITGAGVQEPHLDVDGTLEFGGVVPGSPRTLPLTLGNSGLGTLKVSSLSVTPPTAPFSVNVSVLPDVAPGESTHVQVTYAPVGEGNSDSATLLIESNDPNHGLVQVALSGQGVIPLADVLPVTGLDFGSVLIGMNPAPSKTITVRNSGQGTLTLNSPLRVKDTNGVDVPQYLVTPVRPLPAGITSGDTFTFTLTFTPAATQHYTGSLTLTTNDPNHPTFTLPITGSGNNCAVLPNTSVEVVNGTDCVYQCIPSAVACADQSCVVCPVRHAANPSCTGNRQCAYTCPSNTGEAVDPGNTCATAYNLGTFQDGSPGTTTNFRLYPANDQDWFKFRMKDQTDFFHEGFIPFTTLRVQVTLSGVPDGETYSVELVQDSCSGGGSPSTVGAGQSVTLESPSFCDNTGTDPGGNTVALDDSRDFYVHVFPVGDSYGCSSYVLTVETIEEWVSGLCI